MPSPFLFFLNHASKVLRPLPKVPLNFEVYGHNLIISKKLYFCGLIKLHTKCIHIGNSCCYGDSLELPVFTIPLTRLVQILVKNVVCSCSGSFFVYNLFYFQLLVHFLWIVFMFVSFVLVLWHPFSLPHRKVKDNGVNECVNFPQNEVWFSLNVVARSIPN